MNELRDLEQILIIQDSTANNKEARDANSVPVIKNIVFGSFMSNVSCILTI